MSLIKKPAELTAKETIAALIYGQPGVGKTTLACSAPSPVVIDFDGGMGRLRVIDQRDSVPVQSWDDVFTVLQEIAEAGCYKTVVIDTASKMVDLIITKICGNQNPTIQKWGLINTEFKRLLRELRQMNMNVLFIAQRDKEKTGGEDERYIPQFRASNYKDVVCDLDIVGYMESVIYEGKPCTQITFDPSPHNEGKNAAGFEPSYIIPKAKDGVPITFMTDRFNEYIQRQRKNAAEKAEMLDYIEKRVADVELMVGECEDAESLNAVVDQLKDEKAVGDIRVRLAGVVRNRATALGLTLNKKNRRYE